MFKTRFEISEYHSSLTNKVDTLIQKLLSKEVYQTSKLDSDRDFIISKINELESINLENFENGNSFKYGFVLENLKSSFNTSSPLVLVISNVLPTQKIITFLEDDNHDTEKALLKENLSFQNEVLLNILSKKLWNNSDSLIKDVSGREKDSADFISIETNAEIIDESDLNFLPELLDSLFYHKHQFDNLINLKNLNLSFNTKSDLEGDTFNCLASLEHLNLQGNLIERLNENAVEGVLVDQN
ncbi:unnamed protein product, partial [Brachionus calyciflorus]